MLDYKLGVAYKNVNTLDKAVERLEKLSHYLNDNSISAYQELASIYEREGRVDKLENVLINLGRTYYRKKMLSKARATFLRYLTLRPTNASTHVYLGVVLYDKGNTEQAISQFYEAIKIQPDYYAAHYRLGTIFYEQRLFADAIKELNEALKIFRGPIAAQYALGLVYKAQGRVDDAMNECEAGTKIKYSDYDWYKNSDDIEFGMDYEQIQHQINFNLGLLYKEKGDFSKARYYLNRILEGKAGDQFSKPDEALESEVKAQ